MKSTARPLAVLVAIACVLTSVGLDRKLRAAAPPGRFEERGDIVIDHRNGIAWERAPSATPRHMVDATAYCDGLRIGGYTSPWRLPTIVELQSIVDVRVTPTLDASFGPLPPLPPPPNDDVLRYPFWTSTNDPGDTVRNHFVNFRDGISEGTSLYFAYFVRCVHD